MTLITKSIKTTVACIFLASCSSNMRVETNLDEENFTEYFAAGSVDVFESTNALPGPAKFIGLVEGESCQMKASDATANAADARTEARKKAAGLKANAVVFTSCIDIDEPQCHQLLVCYGKAYQLISETTK
ncbi:Rcs stress response system protein RcsF [Thalassotalea litorea]|uniref:Rcs stress response system protein RcsF n=1 Tax=Thalassotalea litorea TaxID=2020715 RepID=UPI003736DA07